MRTRKRFWWRGLSKNLSSPLPGMVLILIKGKVDRTVTVLVQLGQLRGGTLSMLGAGLSLDDLTGGSIAATI
jgi:hypothetical protein